MPRLPGARLGMAALGQGLMIHAYAWTSTPLRGKVRIGAMPRLDQGMPRRGLHHGSVRICASIHAYA
ncbi:hypothetical protein PIB30_107792, partial [Stylosanthes scabra]|nr:hypothetical protein [Stylosanthes scabra]